MMSEDVLVKDGKLANVMVRVVKGAEGTFTPPATPAKVTQKDCMYRPRVVGAVTGQQVEIVSEDTTGHNVHPYKGDESLFNRAQNTPGSFTKTTADFKTDNGAVTFKCDIHPWMTGWLVVSPTPYFAVTAEDGTAKIENLPAGKYTLEAWHEKYGTKTAEVTVEDGKPAEVKFEFSATDKAAM
jgi:plastocyanin